MNKVYSRINWENYPSEKTAVCEENLNKIDFALDEVDKRVVQHETVKANVASLNELINYWHIDETTGVITIHKVSGEQIIFDLNLEKVPVGFSMTDDGILIMTTDDGTEFTANIGSMIPILTFNDSDQISVAVSGEGVNKSYTFTIKTGSITEDKLQPNFLADCRLYAGNAENSAILAGEHAERAKEIAESISNKASDISFDDTTSQLGADDVQGAIESVKNDVDNVGEETVYSANGGHFVGTNDHGNIVYKEMIPSESKEIPIYVKEVVKAHDDVLERVRKDLYGDSNTRATSLHVNYIGTGTNTKVTIKFKNSNSFALLFGRSSGSAPICTSIAYSAVKNLAEHGTFTASSGTITCTLGTYAMCFLLHNGNIESITYS